MTLAKQLSRYRLYMHLTVLMLFITTALPLRLYAAEALGQLHVSRVSTYTKDGQSHLYMHFVYSSDILNNDQTLYVSPILKDDAHSYQLPAMVIDSQSKKVRFRDQDVIVVADEPYGNFIFEIDYIINYEPWMDEASLCFESKEFKQGEFQKEYLDCVVDHLKEYVDKLKNAPLNPYKVALRTNLLLPLLNIGMEVPIGNRWSVGVDWYNFWLFRHDNHKNSTQLQFLSVEGRYWLGKKHRAGEENRQYRLQGHSVGAFVATGKYDFEHNYKGDQGEFIAGGLDYLYAMPICKGRLHLEFSLAVGFLRASAYSYHVYQPGGKGYYDDKNFREVTRYVGPLKASVALVVPLRYSKRN